MLLLILIGINIFSKQAVLVEKYYSRGMYPFVARTLSGVSSVFPFALGELIILLGSLGGLIVYGMHVFFKNRKKRSMMFIGPKTRTNIMSNLISIVLIVLVVFQLLWGGLNYSRLPLMHVLDLDVKPRESVELYEALVWHIEEANHIREGLKAEDFDKTYNIWSGGYEAMKNDFEPIAMIEGEAKNLVSSTFF